MGLFRRKRKWYEHYGYNDSRLSQHRVRWGVVIPVFVLLIVCGCAAFCFWPVSDDRAEKATVLVENKSCYALEVPGVDTLYFSTFDRKNGFGRMQIVEDSAVVSRYATGFFVSGPQPWNLCDGRVVTSTMVVRPLIPLTKLNMELRKYLNILQNKVLAEKKIIDHQASEFKYYVETHNEEDDGYDQVLLYYRKLDNRKGYLDKIENCVVKALRMNNVKVSYRSNMSLVYRTETADTSYVGRYNASVLASESDSELALLHTTDSVMPEGSKSIRIAPFSVFDGVDHDMRVWLTGFNIGAVESRNIEKVKPAVMQGTLGQMSQQSGNADEVIRTWSHTIPTLQWSEGSVIRSRKGFVVGINQGDKMVEVKAVRRLMQ